nr:hypothetical protein [Priestia megaterium]
MVPRIEYTPAFFGMNVALTGLYSLLNQIVQVGIKLLQCLQGHSNLQG